MRILYVTNGFPYPLTSGYLRHFFLIRELAVHHAVTLLSLAGRDHRPADVEPLRSMTDDVRVFPEARARGAAAKVGRRLRVLAGRPSPAAAALAACAVELDRRMPFDAVVLSGKATAGVMAALPARPIVVDLCDATSLRLEGELSYAPPARRLALLADLRAVRGIERRLIRGAAWRLVASVRDRDALLPPDRRGGTTIVPNGVDADFWHRSTPRLGRDTIVFTGAMHYPPNADAAIHLVSQVLPRVRMQVPSARLLVVGRDPTPQLLRVGREADGVTVTGRVEDVRPYLDQATVFAAPLRFGAGIQNKVLEALAMEVPVVASSLAADGLRLEDGSVPPITVADDPETMAALIAERLRVAAVDDAPHAAGRAYVTAAFRWDLSGRLLSDVLERVTVADAALGTSTASAGA